ncbi:RDD family protein [Chamaesiphon sp. VAR_48_metabat_403]|uniref:RDD family protein n=1 Tax=Chamaesiphon sp. VAR_48_metabat_403 TaxID=2964700 RepID=UPI00286E15D0|nr:RDD family protein [Chamaesiphon sp. VAR_48_metabat_403]
MKYLNRVKSQTPESVELEFVLAGVGNRTQALVIDYLIWSSTIFILLVIWAILFAQITWLQSDTARPWLLAIQILILFGVYIGYFIVFETLWRGQTPGKKYVKIRVIRDDGRNVGIQQSILRSLLRPIDDILFIGLLLILFTPQEKRLGDWVAGTISIQEGQTVSDREITILPAATELATKLIETGKIAALTPDEFAIIRKYLYRYPALSSSAKIQVSDRLALQLIDKIELTDRLPTRDSHLIIEAVFIAYQQQFRG